jgi:hypothetical protein
MEQPNDRSLLQDAIRGLTQQTGESRIALLEAHDCACDGWSVVRTFNPFYADIEQAIRDLDVDDRPFFLLYPCQQPTPDTERLEVFVAEDGYGIGGGMGRQHFFVRFDVGNHWEVCPGHSYSQAWATREVNRLMQVIRHFGSSVALTPGQHFGTIHSEVIP